MGSAGKKSNAKNTSTKGAHKKSGSVFRFAVCINNSEYPASLELHKIYRVLPDDDAASEGDLRIIDESGEDYMYPAEWFVPIKLPQKVKTSVLKPS